MPRQRLRKGWGNAADKRATMRGVRAVHAVALGGRRTVELTVNARVDAASRAETHLDRDGFGYVQFRGVTVPPEVLIEGNYRELLRLLEGAAAELRLRAVVYELPLLEVLGA